LSRSLLLALLILSGLTPMLAPGADMPLLAEDGDTASPDVLQKYLEASKVQQDSLRGVTMDVAIDAELPKLKKQGRLQALRQISRLGKITYDALRFEGDNTIKKELIARYLSTEMEATDKTAPKITPEFYKFRYKGLMDREGTQVYVFQVTPKKKRVGTFKGELWLDRDTYMPVREAGRFAKNPSVFIRQFDFVRTYVIQDGLAIPKKTTGIVQTRLWGKAEMNIEFSNFTKQPDTAAAVTEDGALLKTP
jgi:hypothetical protein